MGIRRKLDQLEPTKVPTNVDIAWAAGIWEGEGSCSDAFDETPEERKRRMSANTMRFYWKHHPEVLAKQNLRRATQRHETHQERVM